MRNTDTFFSFHCPAKTVDDAEVMTIARVPSQFRTEESAVQKTAWFDYLHLHPFQRTYLWTHFYSQAIKNCYAETRDITTADTIQPFKSHELGHEFIGAWLSRQSCDRHGIRYDYFLRWSMTRFSERGWGLMPRPNQLYSQELIEDARDAWKNLSQTVFQWPEHPRFQFKNWQGHPDQKAFLDSLIGYAQTRQNPSLFLASAVAYGYINETILRRVWSVRTATKAMKIVPMLVSQP